MTKLRLSPTTADHVRELSVTMSEADTREVFLSAGDSPSEALWESVGISEWSHSVLNHEGECVAIFGCARHEDLGIPWMLTSKNFKQHGREFARRCRKVMSIFYNKYPSLMNYVSADHHDSIRWLQWCGFTVHDDVVKLGPLNSHFRTFTRCAHPQH